MTDEFKEMPMNSCHDAVGLSGGKNRYSSILPNKDTRVLLKELNGDINTTYIHANYIKGYRGTEKAYIATQGPMSSTVEDFWRMIWEHRSPIIIMVITPEEIQKGKTEIYWPKSQDGAAVEYGHFTIAYVAIEKCKGYTVTTFSVTCDQDDGELCVRHYWYYRWPDQSVPKTARALLRLLKNMHQHLRDHQESDLSLENVNGPIVVHCSAGLGRTGTVIAVDICCQQLKQEEGVDVKKAVAQMRLQRGGVIQNGQQYVFIHDALNLFDLQQTNEHALASTSLTSIEGLQLPEIPFPGEHLPSVSVSGISQQRPFDEPEPLSGADGGATLPTFSVSPPSLDPPGSSASYIPPPSPSPGGGQSFSFNPPLPGAAVVGEDFGSRAPPKSPSASGKSFSFEFP